MAIGLINVSLASTASAAPWIDDKGRFMVMQFPGAPTETITTADHDIAAAASLFKTVCLETNLDRSVAGQRAEASGWGFSYRSSMVPFKDPVDLGGWVTRDAALNVGSGLFFNKHAQCSLTVAVSGAADVAASETAMAAIMGGSPSNATQAFDKKGQRKKYYEPEWTSVDPASGAVTTVFVRSLAGTSGHVQFAALRKAKK